MHALTLASVVLMAVSPVIATGSAIIHNACKFNVTVWSVSADVHNLDKVKSTIAPGANFTEPYQKPSIGGVSLKLSPGGLVSDPITQFEYTLDGFIWYDVSNVNCKGTACPFSEHGLSLNAGKGCPTRSCAAGEAPCAGAYTAWNDDWNSLSCDSKSDIELYLCSENQADSSSSSKASKPKREEFGVPAHRRRTRRHAHHPHARPVPIQ